MIRDRSLPMKMGDLLSLISDDILIGLFEGDNSRLWFGDNDMMNLELIILDISIIYNWIPFHSDMISNKLSWWILYIIWDWTWYSRWIIWEDILILMVVYYIILVWWDITYYIILFLMIILSTNDNDDDDNDEELLLIDIEKKMEWYKIMELFNTKIWINRIKEFILYGTILYPS
jgi:hypothetical protein